MWGFWKKKKESVAKKEELPQDWREVLAQSVVRIDALEKQVAKLYLRQQKPHKEETTLTGARIVKETDKYIIFADGKIVNKGAQ